MPGTVTVVKPAVGDEVTEGQGLLVVEAMKMEHLISAPHDGTVTELEVTPGSAGPDPSGGAASILLGRNDIRTRVSQGSLTIAPNSAASHSSSAHTNAQNSASTVAVSAPTVSMSAASAASAAAVFCPPCISCLTP
jgi:pyruvate/2-oxoglutarate dehydrogenase complex dihydrolipoamide acyltransferase (E2) component